MNRTKARGKVLVCRHTGSSTESKLEKSKVVKEAGGIGMVLIDDADQDVAIPFVIPSAIVGRRTGSRILSYISHTRFVSCVIIHTNEDLMDSKEFKSLFISLGFSCTAIQDPRSYLQKL